MLGSVCKISRANSLFHILPAPGILMRTSPSQSSFLLSHFSRRYSFYLLPFNLSVNICFAPSLCKYENMKCTFCITLTLYVSADVYLNNLKRDPLDIQHPKFENSRLGLIESVHKR